MVSRKTNAERETIIRRAADEQEWEVYSEDPRVIRKLTAIYGPGRVSGTQSDGRVWQVPPNGLSFRKPVVLSAAEKERRASRLAAARSARKSAEEVSDA